MFAPEQARPSVEAVTHFHPCDPGPPLPNRHGRAAELRSSRGMLFDIVGRRYLFFALSLIILVPGLIALLVWGLRPGIDFTGGTLWEIIPKAGGQVDPGQVRATLQAAGQPAAQVIMAELRGGAQVTSTLQIRMP